MKPIKNKKINLLSPGEFEAIELFEPKKSVGKKRNRNSHYFGRK